MGSKKRAIALIAAIVTTGLLLAGCSGGSASTGHATTGTLKFYTDKAAWKPQFTSLNSTSQKDAKISITTTGYSNENQYQAFIKQAFRTKQSPGLFTWATGDALKQLVDQHLVADTSSIWKQAIASGDVPQSLEKYYTYDGKQYCVPLNIAYWVIYYNKQSFAKAGITSTPTTWAQLTDDATKLKSNGITPFYQTSTLFTFPWFQSLVAGTSTSLYNGLENGTVKYTDPRIVKLMNTWEQEEKAGWFSDAGSQTTPQQGLKEGDYAMVDFGTWFSASLDAVGMKSDSQYSYFVIPAVDSSNGPTAVPVETGPLCVATSSSQKDLGLAYSKWWMTSNAQSAVAKALGGVSFDPKAQATDPQLAKLGATIASNKYTLINRYYDATPTTILTTALDEFGAFEANPGDVQKHLQTIQAVADKFWASNK